jgi:hypothetical protein
MYEDEMGRAHGTNVAEDRVLVGKPKGKTPLGRPKRKWKHNSKMDISGIGWGQRLY